MLHSVPAPGIAGPGGKGRRDSTPVNRRAKSVIRAKLPRTVEKQMIRDYLEALNTPRALTVWLLYAAGEHRQVVELGIDPLMYENTERFRRDYAATKLLSKHSGLATGIDTREVAIKAANAAEDRCRETNCRLKSYRSSPSDGQAYLDSIFHRAKRKIAMILGETLPDFRDESRDPGWSNGRTTSAHGDDLSPTRKYLGRPDVTNRAIPYALQMVATSPIWGAAILDADAPCSILEAGLFRVKGNVQTVVPKNAKTDRVICYEPHLNVRLQLIAGSFIRKRLRCFGVNLNDQQVNRRRAQLASKTGHLATVDLKSASDTICRELVYDLLPIDWAMMLDALCSHYTCVGEEPDGSPIYRRNEKFSSMGNGFTFELESLIFYALASAVTSGVSVYGDDLILPVEHVDEVCKLLELVGFEVNQSKTFRTGHFRESCGMDAFRGTDCTPPYLRSSVRLIEDAIKFHNAVYAWCYRSGFCPTEFHDVLVKWRGILQAPLGPFGYGDGHLHACFDDVCPSRASRGWDGWWYTTYLRRYSYNLLGTESGVVNRTNGYGALCAVTGPRRLENLQKSEVARGKFKCIRTRSVATVWPSIRWV